MTNKQKQLLIDGLKDLTEEYLDQAMGDLLRKVEYQEQQLKAQRKVIKKQAARQGLTLGTLRTVRTLLGNDLADHALGNINLLIQALEAEQ